MTDLTDEQIEALCEAATTGPWHSAGREVVLRWANVWQAIASVREHGLEGPLGVRSIANAEFIAAARTLVPSLLERARKAEAERDALMKRLTEERAERDAMAAKLRAVEAESVVSELRELWQRALEREGNLASAVADVVWKAAQYGTTEDGDTFAYIVPSSEVGRD